MRKKKNFGMDARGFSMAQVEILYFRWMASFRAEPYFRRSEDLAWAL
jgi:hypothetical protein